MGKNKVLKLINLMGIQAIHPKKRKLISNKNHEHKIHRYALKGLEIIRPNQVWSGNINCIPVHGRFNYIND